MRLRLTLIRAEHLPIDFKSWHPHCVTSSSPQHEGNAAFSAGDRATALDDYKYTSLADKAYTDALANCRPRDIPGAVSDLKKLLAKHPGAPLFQSELLHVEQASKSPSR